MKEGGGTGTDRKKRRSQTIEQGFKSRIKTYEEMIGDFKVTNKNKLSSKLKRGNYRADSNGKV